MEAHKFHNNCNIIFYLKPILGPDTILTSARCLHPLLETYVFAGMTEIELKLPIARMSAKEGQIVKVSKAILHEKLGTASAYDYDIAVALLSEKLTYSGRKTSVVNKTALKETKLA